MFHRVGPLCMISTRDKISLAVDEKYGEWCIERKWFNETIFKNFIRHLFEGLEIRENTSDITSLSNGGIKGHLIFSNDTSDQVILVQLKYSAGNVNHAVIIMGSWLPLMRESLDIICSPSKDEKCIYAEYKEVFYAFRYENPLTKSENEH